MRSLTRESADTSTFWSECTDAIFKLQYTIDKSILFLLKVPLILRVAQDIQGTQRSDHCIQLGKGMQFTLYFQVYV